MGSFFQIPKKTIICKTGIITSISIYHFNGKKRIRNNQKKNKNTNYTVFRNAVLIQSTYLDIRLFCSRHVCALFQLYTLTLNLHVNVL